MNSKLSLIMPMGGRGSRFFESGEILPKPLIELQSKPFFYWATQSIVKYIEVDQIIFVVLQEHEERYDITSKIKYYYPSAQFEYLKEVLNGPVLTCMRGIGFVNKGNQILVNDCDHAFRCDAFKDFLYNVNNTNISGALLTFRSDNPNYSYVILDGKNNVIGTKEKEVMSGHAICGAYYFKSVEIFEKSANDYLKNCVYSEYFMSGLYNTLISKKNDVCYFDTNFHLAFGTPEEFEYAKDSNFLRWLE